MIAAYKLRLADKAAALGARPETWGRGQTISPEAEKRHLTKQDKYRIAPYPYPGLRSFDPEEGQIFFARERNVESLRTILAERRLVVVLGGSGSGKSSLIRAGLLPFLNTERRISGRDGNWYAVEFRPRTNPLGELSNALVNQLLRPLLRMRPKGLAEAVGLDRDADGDAESTIKVLHDQMFRRFTEAKNAGRKQVLNTVLEIADRQLELYDGLATQGRRLAEPNLFLLVDQLEEVFRPEIAFDERDALLNLIVDIHDYMKQLPQRGGLFLAATIRSEEVYRCAEHRGLSEVVIGSGYQLELLDADNPEDASDLRRAIVQPGRNVFEDWGLAEHLDHPDAPFAKEMPDLLLQGAARLSVELYHRPDQLPLLQHALQATWHSAMRRWSDPSFTSDRLEIVREDLPGQSDSTTVPDLGACLKARADKAAHRAAERFAEITGTDQAAGQEALQAAFRALARRDDRGNWARRFAGRDEITAFLTANPGSAVARLPDNKRWSALREALHVFLLRGYLSGGNNQEYDISHEALIRNWPVFQDWLRGPEEVAYALGRVLVEVEPGTFEKAPAGEKMRLIPEELSARVAMVKEGGKLPGRWGEDQIAPYLLRPALRRRWGGDKHDVLLNLTRLAALAEQTRIQTANDARAAERKEAAAERKEAAERARREARSKFALLLSAGLTLLVGAIGYAIYQSQAASQAAAVAEAAATVAKAMARSEKAMARSEVAEAQKEVAEAQKQAAEARVIAEQRQAEAARLLWRQMAANSLIGSMQSQTGNWPDGARERAALHALHMLGGGGTEANPDVLRELTWARWDSGVRAILGQQFRITRMDHVPSWDRQLSCIVFGDKPAPAREPSSASSLPVVLRGSESTEIRLAASIGAQLRLRFETREGGQDWREAAQDGSIDTPPDNTRLCLAPNGAVMTVSSPGAPLPFVYELHWRTCQEGSDCSNASWRVRWREIRPSAPLGVSDSDAFPCVRSIRVNPRSNDGRKALRVEVDFTAEKPEAACDPDRDSGGSANQSFQASYAPGIATAMLNRTPEQMPRFARCEDKEGARRCDLGLEPNANGEKSILVLRRKTQPQLIDHWSMSIEPFRPEFAVNDILLVAPEIAEAAVDERGNVWVSDGKGLFWELINDRTVVTNALWEGASLLVKDPNWTKTVPPEVWMNMSEAEISQGPP